MLTYLPLFLKERLAFSAVHASQWLSVTQGGAVLGRIGWGTVSDRLYGGRRKVVLVLVGVISVLLCAALSTLDGGVSPFILVPLTFLGGFTMIGYQGVSYSLISEIAGQSRAGMALGLMISINALGTVVGTPAFGYIVDATGSYATAWQALAVVLAMGTAGQHRHIRIGTAPERGRTTPSVLSHVILYQDAQDFLLSARRDDEQWRPPHHARKSNAADDKKDKQIGKELRGTGH